MKITIFNNPIFIVLASAISLAFASDMHKEKNTKLFPTPGYYFVSIRDPCHVGITCDPFGGPLCTYAAYQLWGKANPLVNTCNVRLYQVWP